MPPNFIPSIGFQIPPENNFRQAPNRFTPIQTKPENKSKMEEEKPSKQDSQIKGGEMSNSLSNYVKKSFEKCQNDKERQIIEKALKKILNNAKLRGEYETRNWDNCPIPLLPREAKVN